MAQNMHLPEMKSLIFGIRKEDLMEITICVGSSCHLKGAEDVIKKFKELIEKENIGAKIVLKGSFCMGKCSEDGVTVKIGDEIYKTNPQSAEDFFYNKVIPMAKGE